MFVEAGLTPMQAIQAATVNVAKAFRKDTDFGTVEPGKVADLIAVDGDPLKDVWTTQNVKLVVLGGKIVDHEFHANHKNPIPAIRPWRATPQEIELSPRSVVQGSGAATVKITTRRGFDRFHKATLAGKELETRFISPGEIEATVPPALTKQAGTYPSSWSAKAIPPRSRRRPISLYRLKNRTGCHEHSSHADPRRRYISLILSFDCYGSK